MKKAIITGCNGFIGLQMTKFLIKKGYFVYGIGTNDVKELEGNNNFKFIYAVFEDYKKLHELIPTGIDLFYHFAWQGVFGVAFKDYNLQMKNATYVGDCVELAHKLNTKKFILASTVNVLEILNKNSFLKPRFTSIYASAKFAAEHIARVMCFNYSINFNCGLIGMVYGPNNYSKMVTNIVISKLIKGESPSLVEGNNLYDLVYIGDVVKAFYYIGEKGISPKTYYVGSNSLRTFKEIFTEVGKIINPNIKLNFGQYTDDNSLAYDLIDIKALKNDTGFECGTDFKNTILETAKWIKDTNWEERVKQ